MQLINSTLLNEVTKQAQESPRLRMNHNFHESLDAKAQRLLNALEQGTILPSLGGRGDSGYGNRCI